MEKSLLSDTLSMQQQMNNATLDPSASISQDSVSPSDTNKLRDENGFEVRHFFTDYGTQRISIDGDLSSGRPVLMTYHDIGINHTACFLSFFNMLRAYDAKFRYFTVIHIDAPQHHYEDDAASTNSKTPKFYDGDLESYDLLELASQIEEIRSALGIDRFVAMGVGAATNVWTYYAMNYSSRLRGMVLLNGLGSAASWREWIFEQLLRGMGAQSQFLADSLNSSLLTRYFPRASVSAETYDYFVEQFGRLHTPSVIKYVRGFGRRKEFSEEQLQRIKVKTLIICGEDSRVKDETIAFQKMMPRQYTTFVLMSDTGFLLTESHPQKLCSSMDLFMQSLGLTKTSLKFKFGELEPEETDEATL